MTLTYPRPEVTRAAEHDAVALAAQLINHKSTAQIRLAVAGLLLENQRLTLEVNEHRAARGYAPLAVHTERG